MSQSGHDMQELQKSADDTLKVAAVTEVESALLQLLSKTKKGPEVIQNVQLELATLEGEACTDPTKPTTADIHPVLISRAQDYIAET